MTNKPVESNTKSHPQESKLRVVIGDAQPASREGLQSLLEARGGFQVTAVFARRGDLLAGIGKVDCDVLLIDPSLGDEDSMELLKLLGHRHPELPVVVLSARVDPLAIRQAMEAGAAGYLARADATSENVAQALRHVAAGACYYLGDVARAVRQQLRLPGDPEAGPTPQQRRVLERVVQGETNAEIGAAMHLSGSRVKAILRKLYERLNARDRVHAVVLALKLGWVELPD